MRQDRLNYKAMPLLALLSLLVISCNKPSPTTSSNEESSKETSTKVTSSEESTESSKESSTTTSILEETYTITWKNHDGTILEVDENVKKGDTPSYDGAAPTKPNDDRYSYTFNGWDPSISEVIKDEVYTATYKQEKLQFNITYNLNGGVNHESNPTSYNFEDNITLYPATKTGYGFEGWFDDETNLKVDSITDGTTGDLVLNAKWNDGNGYVVTFDPNGGELLSESRTVKFGSPYTLPKPTKYGFGFIGWYNGEEEKIESEGIWNIASNVTLVAKWNDGNTYTLTLNTDGGDLEQTEYQIKFNTSYTLPIPSKTGYSFVGWYKDNKLMENEGIWNVDKNQTFVAKWKANEYKVTLDPNGGEVSQTNFDVRFGLSANFPDPTKEGYTFEGWYYEETRIYSNRIWKIADNVTLIAKWKANRNALSVFSMDAERGATTIVSGNGLTDEEITVKATPYEGYLFYGWYRDGLTFESEEATYTFVMPSADVNLQARFLTQAEINAEKLKNFAIKPIVSADSNKLTYGLYPQSYVNNEGLISKLDNLTETGSNGWYLFNKQYYTKIVASPCSNNYTFSNGNPIEEGKSYWFKCEPISWDIIQTTTGERTVITSSLLDAKEYHGSTETRKVDGLNVYPNNYQHSDIRKWLINDFYNTAFKLNSSYIKETVVDNSPDSAGLKDDRLACGDTNDKVFLLSYKDYKNINYGFPDATTTEAVARRCKPTDFAKARGAYSKPTQQTWSYGYGIYWTRSPSDYDAFATMSSYVDPDGRLLSSGNVLTKNHCPRPAMVLKTS